MGSGLPQIEQERLTGSRHGTSQMGAKSILKITQRLSGSAKRRSPLPNLTYLIEKIGAPGTIRTSDPQIRSMFFILSHATSAIAMALSILHYLPVFTILILLWKRVA